MVQELRRVMGDLLKDAHYKFELVFRDSKRLYFDYIETRMCWRLCRYEKMESSISWRFSPNSLFSFVGASFPLFLVNNNQTSSCSRYCVGGVVERSVMMLRNRLRRYKPEFGCTSGGLRCSRRLCCGRLNRRIIVRSMHGDRTKQTYSSCLIRC